MRSKIKLNIVAYFEYNIKKISKVFDKKIKIVELIKK